jgi:hypothetical protein
MGYSGGARGNGEGDFMRVGERQNTNYCLLTSMTGFLDIKVWFANGRYKRTGIFDI